MSSEQRELWIQQEFGQDSAFADELRRLFQAGLEKSDFLEIDPVESQVGETKPEEFSAPETLGDFEIGELLGRGAHGEVFLARQRSLDRLVAIKLLTSSRVSDARRTLRFHREAIHAAKLQHPNIVQVLTCDEEEGIPYLVMEYVEGHSLFDELRYLKPKQLELASESLIRRRMRRENRNFYETVAVVFQELAQALHHAHSRRIIHRDVKPANILLSARGVPKLVDFGLARRMDQPSSTLLGQFRGTPAYMSPEQANLNNAEVRAVSDVYSLGVTLYEVLTGEQPFLKENLQETLKRVQSFDPPTARALNPRVPKPLEAICFKAMNRKGSRRYGSAKEFAEDLGRYLEGRLPLAKNPPKVLRLMNHLWRRRSVAALVVALSFASIALRSAFQPPLEASPKADLPVVSLDWKSNHPTISVRKIDLETGTPTGSWRNLGNARKSHRLDSGQYRFQVQNNEGVLREGTVSTLRGDANVPVYPNLDLEGMQMNDRMVFVPGGFVRLYIENEHGGVHKEWEEYVKGFYIDPRPVTVGDYLDFVRLTKLPRAMPPMVQEPNDLPVTKISLRNMKDFAYWRNCRLPTEAEWLRFLQVCGIWPRAQAMSVEDFVQTCNLKTELTPVFGMNFTKEEERQFIKQVIRPVPSIPLGLKPEELPLAAVFGNIWESTSTIPRRWNGEELEIFSDFNVIIGGSYTTEWSNPSSEIIFRRKVQLSRFRTHDVGFRCVRGAGKR